VSQGNRSIDVSESAQREVHGDQLSLQTLVREGRSFSGRERHCCFLNTGGPRFADISAVSNLDLPDDGRAIAAGDWDQDGDLDLWIANRNGPQVRFLRNEIPTSHHFLSVSLVGTQCNRDAIGARVALYLRGEGNARQLRTLHAGNGYLSQSSKSLHFGLGLATQIDRVDVHWPGGTIQSFRGLEVDSAYRLTQGTGTAEVLPRGERPIGLSAMPPIAAEVPPPHVLLASHVPLPALEYIADDGTTDRARAPLLPPGEGARRADEGEAQSPHPPLARRPLPRAGEVRSNGRRRQAAYCCDPWHVRPFSRACAAAARTDPRWDKAT
jgi:hypothetical protein